MIKSISYQQYKVVFENDGEVKKITVFENDMPMVYMSCPVNADYEKAFNAFGNGFYVAIRDNKELLSDYEYLLLDFDIIVNDFGTYSDAYKDLNYCRPHLTKEQWEELVKQTRIKYHYI